MVTLPGGIIFDRSRRELLIITWPATPVTERDIQDYVEQLSREIEDQIMMVCIVDLSAAPQVSAKSRAIVGRWMEDNRSILRRCMRGLYCVSDSMITRIALKTFSVALGVGKIVGGIKTFGTLSEARQAALQLLEQENTRAA